MATASSMVINSLIMIGEKVIGGTLTSAEQTHYLAKLNSFLESCSLERLLVYQIIEEAFTLVVGSEAYTIGTGGNFNTSRPTKIEDTCVIDFQNTLYPVDLVDEKTFTALQTVGQTQMPTRFFYDTGFPLGTIYFDFIPDIAYDFHLKSWKQIQSFAAITDTVSLPPGYQRFIESNFAIECAPGLTSVSQEVLKIAKESKAAVKSINLPEYKLRLDPGVSGHIRIGGSSIFTG